VRTVLKDGEVWFVAKDVAEILGYKNTNDTIIRHCKKKQTIGKREGLQIVIIPESDVYRLVIKSQLPSAEKFESWVMEEVLPSVRKHGAYMTPETIEKAILNPEFIIKLATELKEERSKRIEAEQTNELLMGIEKTYTTEQIAKELGMRSSAVLNKRLEQIGVQYKRNGTWLLHSAYADKGYMEIKQKINFGHTYYHSRWTQKGRLFLLNVKLGEIS
jgi:anti-repressor protein